MSGGGLADELRRVLARQILAERNPGAEITGQAIDAHLTECDAATAKPAVTCPPPGDGHVIEGCGSANVVYNADGDGLWDCLACGIWLEAPAPSKDAPQEDTRQGADVCMCGSPMHGHAVIDNHSPVSMADHYQTDQGVTSDA